MLSWYAHTHVDTRARADITGPLLRSRPFCDIWKGQVQHHSNRRARAHARTLWPPHHQVSAWACTPHRSPIRRLTSETRISLLPQGLDSKHSFHLAVSLSFGAAAQTAEARCLTHTQTHTDIHRHTHNNTHVCTHDTAMSYRLAFDDESWYLSSAS